MPERVIAVYPTPDGEGSGWTSCELVSSDGPKTERGTTVRAEDGSPVRLSAGVAVILARSVSTAGLSSAVFLDAVSSVVGAVEVVGSDGATMAVVTGGRPKSGGELDLALTGLVVEVDGLQVATAAGAAAAGHPARAAAAGLGAAEDTLAQGTTVFTGRWMAPVDVLSGGHFQACFGHLGGISVRVL